MPQAYLTENSRTASSRRTAGVSTIMDKNAEVLVCGASIMKDVWEIRLREYWQKWQKEEERRRKSALERINQDWQTRMSSKIKTPKRLERKAKLPEESSLDDNKAKKMHLGRPQGFQSSRVQRQADLKTAKPNKLALLRHLNESCPGLMVWAKSWKFSKPLPKPEESPCTFDWGQSWKLFNIQPNTDGKPWFDLGFDANDMMSTRDMFLWEKLSKALNSEDNQQDLVTPEWQKSWVFTQKGKESHEGTNNNKSENKSYNLWGGASSDWHESWKSTKPVQEGEIRPDLIQPSANEEKQPELQWNISWMYFKKQLHMKSKATSNNLAWSESWRVAKTVSEQEEKSIPSHAMMHPNICKVIMNVSPKMKHALQFAGRDTQPSEWEKSWTTIKNLSEYKEEINKPEREEVEVKVEMPKPDNFKQQSTHLKFNILALPKRQRRQEMFPLSKQTDWKDSWKTLKNQRREECNLRNHRRPPPQVVSTSQTPNEWANSWRFTNLTLNQDAGLWQQGWSTIAQFRPIRRIQENNNVPHNGPAAVRGWSESWRSAHRLENQGAAASTQPVHRHTYARSMADWEESWRSSTQQRHHDRPSMTEWTNSWRFSSSEHLPCDHTWFETSMAIKDRKELRRALNAFSKSFDPQTFKERYSSKYWNDSWRVKTSPGPGLAHLMKKEVLDWDNSWMFTSTGCYEKQGECYLNFHLVSDVRSSAMLKSIPMESRSVWGQSWKLSNPQPTKNIASWVDAQPKAFSAQDAILWSKHKCINYLPCALSKDLKLKIWSKSWRFMKMDIDSKQGGGSVMKTKTAKVRNHTYSNIDQLKPQQKRWSDAFKMAKAQPKRSVRSKSGHKEDKDGTGMFAEWMTSWKFSNPFKSHEPISLSDWKSSWKFLLDPSIPVNGPKTGKSR